MPITCSNIVETFDQTTHNLGIKADQAFPDGATNEVLIAVPGPRYDAAAALLAVYATPAQWTNLPTLTPSALVTWIQANPSATILDVLAQITASAGPIVPADVARLFCEMDNLLKTARPNPAPPPAAQGIPPISL